MQQRISRDRRWVGGIAASSEEEKKKGGGRGGLQGKKAKGFFFFGLSGMRNLPVSHIFVGAVLLTLYLLSCFILSFSFLSRALRFHSLVKKTL